MFSLITILKENIREANLDRDVNKEKEAENYIKMVNSYIDSYKQDTRKINLEPNMIKTFFKGIDIFISSHKGNGTDAAFQPGRAGYDPVIMVFNADIQTSPKLSAKYDENALRHELIHFLDAKTINPNNKTNKNDTLRKTSVKSREKMTPGNNTYVNHGLELNAHFFELFFPEVMKYVEKQQELPNDVNTFIKNVIKDGEPKQMFSQLNPENKKKVLKRLGTYHDIIKNGAQKPTGQVDNNKVQSITKNFINKLKQTFGFK